MNYMDQNCKIDHSSLISKMQGTIASLQHSFKGIRTNRVSTALLDPIQVHAYGNNVFLNQISSISALDVKTLAIQIWDKKLLSSAEKAILDSGLGLVPNTEGQIIKLYMPKLSNDRRKELVKKVSEYSEQARIGIRNNRRIAMDDYKSQEKNKLISKDQYRLYSQEIQKITDGFVEKINNITNIKSKEIMDINN